MQGRGLENKFVTSYKMLFSEDGHAFSYVLDDGKQPRVFRGPVDAWKPVEQKFYVPIEAKVVRINPLSWHNEIAMQVELLGCQEFAVSTTSVTQSVSVTTALTVTEINPGIVKINSIELRNIVSVDIFIFIFVFSV